MNANDMYGPIVDILDEALITEKANKLVNVLRKRFKLTEDFWNEGKRLFEIDENSCISIRFLFIPKLDNAIKYADLRWDSTKKFWELTVSTKGHGIRTFVHCSDYGDPANIITEEFGARMLLDGILSKYSGVFLLDGISDDKS